MVISGDLADTPSEAAYVHLTALLAALEIPFVAIPGNHDDRALMRSALPHEHATPGGALNFTRNVGGIDILLVDSSVAGTPHGTLDDATPAWLDTTLAQSTTRPELLFLHHPPFVCGIAHMDVQNLSNAGDLAKVVHLHDRARLVAAGRVHRATRTQFAGVPATTCPAPNHAVALDLEGHLPPSSKIEPPAFHLHVWFPGGGFGRLVTHTVLIGDFVGPHPLFDSDGQQL